MFDPMDLYYVEICYSLIFFAKYNLNEQTKEKHIYKCSLFILNT